MRMAGKCAKDVLVVMGYGLLFLTIWVCGGNSNDDDFGMSR
jgi:hypothetical protein